MVPETNKKNAPENGRFTIGESQYISILYVWILAS